MTRLTAVGLPGALVLLSLAWGCADAGPDVGGLADEVAEHRRMWESSRPATYAFELERLCFCGTEARGPVRLTVEGDVVVTRVYSDSGTEVPEEYAEIFPTVDGLFDILDDALRRGAEQVDVTWDATSGAPTYFFIDYSRNVADEEVGYHILAGPS